MFSILSKENVRTRKYKLASLYLDNSSMGKSTATSAEGREFESRLSNSIICEENKRNTG